MIASPIPPTRPIAIDSTVSTSVLFRPFSTGGEKRYSPTTGQRKPGLVRIVLTSIAASTASTATASHRPGCRTGTALIGGGRRVVSTGEEVVTGDQLRISEVG